MAILQKLSGNPANEVVIVSGRRAKDLERWFGHLPISLVAEHGASSRLAGSKTWRAHKKTNSEWRATVLPVLEKYAALTPGAHVETKDYALVWHYRASPSYYAHKNMTIIKRILKPYLKKNDIVIQKGDKVIEFKDPWVTKGAAAQLWLQKEYDFVIAIGDDATDEDMFKVMPDGGYSVKVGSGMTMAKYRVADCYAVHGLLERLVATTEK